MATNSGVKRFAGVDGPGDFGYCTRRIAAQGRTVNRNQQGEKQK